MLPAAAEILGVRFSIEEADLGADAGVSSASTRTIKIDRNLPDDVKQETVQHEIVHMILDLTGLSQVINNDQLEEAICQAVGMGFHSVVYYTQEMKYE